MTEKIRETQSGDIDTWPFPERVSSHLDRFTIPEPIPLTDTERVELYDFEAELYREMERSIDFGTKPEQHTVYLEAFESEEGRRLFSLVYGNKELWLQTEELLKDRSEQERKIFYNALLQDLIIAASSESDFDRVRNGEYEFENTVSAEVVDEMIMPLMRTDREEEDRPLKEIFLNADLRNIPTEIRSAMHSESSAYSNNKLIEAIKEEFTDGEGNIDNISDPQRISSVVNPEDLATLLDQLRHYKSYLRGKAREIKSTDLPDKLRKAELEAISLFRRYINYKIEDNYKYGRLIAQKTERSEEEEKVLELLSKGIRKEKRSKFRDESASRTLQRIDRLMQGIITDRDDEGRLQFSSFTQEMDEAAREKMKIRTDIEGKDKKKFNADDAIELGNQVLKEFGFDTWEFMIDENAKGVRIKAVREGEGKKDKVIVPADYFRTVKEIVRTVASELGHVWRIEAKREVFADGLMIMKRLYTGQVGVMGEGLDKYFSNRISREVFGFGEEDEAKPFAYLILRQKSDDGITFKEAVVEALRLRAEKEGSSLQDYLSRKNDSESEKALKGTARYWRKYTPTDERSTYLPDTTQLNYIEGEIVTEKLLEDEELWPLAFVSGIDLYTACQLSSLGELDLSRVQRPDFKKIASIIREFLDKQGIAEE